MKNKVILMAGVVMAMVATTAQAIPNVTGTIDMSGTATLNNTDLGLATAATSFSAVTVGGTPTGSFAGTGGQTVNWSAFSWPSGLTVSPLWTFTMGLTTYRFDLSNDTIVSQNSSYLNLAGVGTATVTGYNPTTAAWSFTISNAGGGQHANFAFTFANSQTAVPDGGMSVVLLGLALAGMAGVRRLF